MERQQNYAVEVEDLTVAYDAKPVLWDIDLKIPRGKLMAVVGPNGAGKTTLIKAMLGLLKPVTGAVRFLDGNDDNTYLEKTHRLCTSKWQRGLGFPGHGTGCGADGLLWQVRLDPPSPQIRYRADKANAGKGGYARVRFPSDQPAFRRPAAAGFPGPCPGPGSGSLLYG